MVQVVLPGILAAQAGGRKRFELDAATVEDALRALPVADLLFDERGQLRPLVNVYVDGRDMREDGSLGMALAGASEVRVVGAVAGG
ncbi:MAG: MoaD/ThiS family protein [Gaiellaceae bacterium]